MRTRRGITAEALADRMRALGVSFDKSVLANLETGRRRFVTVQELLALALVLNVAPLHLVVPIDGDSDLYRIAPNHHAPEGDTPTLNHVVRSWIRGEAGISGASGRDYFLEAPESEVERHLKMLEAFRRMHSEGGGDGER